MTFNNYMNDKLSKTFTTQWFKKRMVNRELFTSDI